MTENDLKIPPNSLYAEKGILGSILFEPQQSIKICLRNNLGSEDFYDRRNQLIYEQIIKMHHSRRAMDAITISQWLSDSKHLDNIGGFDYLVDLQDTSVIPSNCETYISIIKEKSSLRKLIIAGSEIVDSSYNCFPAEEVCSKAKVQLLNAFSKSTEKNKTSAINRIMQEVEDGINGVNNAIPTPFEEMDLITGGLRRKMVTLFTGRSKSGKSMLKAAWLNVLGKKNIPFLDFCFEDGEDITKKRMASNLGNFEMSLFTGRKSYLKNGCVESVPITKDELKMLAYYLSEVERLPIYFHERKCFANELKGICADYVDEYNIQGAFVDGNKDIKRNPGCYNDTGTDEEISQTQTEIAKELNIAIIPIMHLTKIPYDQIITEGAIRGSGNIVSDSRAVYALQNYGIESEAERAGKVINRNEYGNMTTRRFDCIVNNHGQSARIWIESDLGRCQFVKQ
jgi:replicative DNA helicase